MFFLQVHSNFEERLFQRIATRAVGEFSQSDLESSNEHIQLMIKKKWHTNKLTDIEKLKKINTLTHSLLGPPRKLLFLPGSEKAKGIVDKKLHSSMISLLGGYACYMHSQVFGRLAESLGYKYKNFHMMNNNKHHHVAEVNVNDDWLIFDPLFNQVFKNPEGNLVGTEQIHENWDFYKKQIGNECLFDRSDYKYDMVWNYTPKVSSKSYVSNVKDGVLYIWSKLLGYERSNRLKTKMQLNRYFYWQLYLSTLFIGLNVFCLICFFGIRRFKR